MLEGKEMQEVKVQKYLGEFLSNSLSESAHQTVMKRVNIARMSIYEIRAIVEDTRADRIGSMNVAFEIWEKSILPMLFLNAECWFQVPKKTMNILNGLYSQFFSSIFRISGCPRPSFYFQTGTNTVANTLLHRKLVFWHHLKTLPDGSLAKMAVDLKMNNNGLKGTVCSEIKDF